MPKYHFHRDGERDHEGTELTSLRHARAEAMNSVGHTLIDEARRDGLEDGLHMEVTDSDGLDLYHLDVAITASPAAAPKDRGR